MVNFSNRIGADPYFNIPLMANDDFVERFARYVYENLDPNLVASVELSNEVWNEGFTANKQAGTAASALW